VRNIAATMMLKTCHKAIAKLAKVPNHAGASAIFQTVTSASGTTSGKVSHATSNIDIATAAAASKAKKCKCLPLKA
jgi:hypothetical protein